VTALLSFPREKIRILLLEGIHENAVEAFHRQGYTSVRRVAGALPHDELREAVADAHMVGIRSRSQLNAEVIAAGRRLLAIGCYCIGTNQVDLGAAAERGIPVFNAPHSNTRSVAEMVIGLTIMLMRDTFGKARAVRDGTWPKSAAGSHEVRGKTIGIVGYGHIGTQVSILAEALGLRVIFHDIVPTLPLGNAHAVDSLDALLRQADLVTFHVPETELTAGLMNADRIGRMRPGAFLINTSRGPVVDQHALADALKSGHLSGAAVDVFPEEPRATDAPLQSPLRECDNIILTPHVAGSTLEAQEKIGSEVAFKLIGYSDHGSTVGAVNFPQISLAEHRNAHRILHIHENVPGILRQINAIIAEENINVLAQHLETKGDIGYVVLDIGKVASTRLYARIKSIEGTVRARILY